MSNRPKRLEPVSRRTILKTGVIAVGTFGTIAPAAANNHGVTIETADVFGQGPTATGAVVAADGATIRRTPNSIAIRLAMPTPVPGEYTYPPEPGPDDPWTNEEGPPEVFSLWAAVWNDPQTGDVDPVNWGAWDGAFHVAGHVVDGPVLNLSGALSTTTEPFVGDALDTPDGAGLLLAVAPHGALDPERLPDALQTPAGSPAIWWYAVFDPAA